MTDVIYHQHLRMIVLWLFTRRCICCPSFATVPPLEQEMCLIVNVKGLRSCNVTVSCGTVVLMVDSSLKGVRLSTCGDCSP